MGVVSCNIDYGYEYTESEDRNREHSIKWVIVCDAKHDSYTVRKLAKRVGPDRLPEQYTPHPADPRAALVSLTISQREQSTVYDAVGKYSTKPPNSESRRDRSGDPTLRRPRYRLELMQFERRLDRDIFGNPIQNTIGMPFDPPLTVDDSRQVLVGIRNIRTLGEIVAMQQYFKDAVNLNPFYGAAPRQAKVVSITAGEPQNESGVDFYEVAIRVAFKERGETWDQNLLNHGMARRIENPFFDPDNPSASPQYIVTTKDEQGDPITAPLKLDQDGFLLSDDDDPVFLKYRVFPERDFRGLGI